MDKKSVACLALFNFPFNRIDDVDNVEKDHDYMDDNDSVTHHGG